MGFFLSKAEASSESLPRKPSCRKLTPNLRDSFTDLVNRRVEHIFGQQVTVRDALAPALTLDAFNRNAEKCSFDRYMA